MQTEYVFVIWSCIRNKGGVSSEKNGLSPSVVYTAVRSKANNPMLIIFVVILAFLSPALWLTTLLTVFMF